jgi:hypothetical protein
MALAQSTKEKSYIASISIIKNDSAWRKRRACWAYLN